MTCLLQLTPLKVLKTWTRLSALLVVMLMATTMYQVSIQRVWERDSRTVVVRWNLRCFPRILDNVMGTMVNLDGLSEYHFNDSGYVQMHKVTPLKSTLTPQACNDRARILQDA